LIWLLSGVGNPYYVENIVAEVVASGTPEERLRNLEKFSIFWRLSEETKWQPSYVFSRPLFLMFDTLSSENPMLRRGGETWLRSYVKSYIRILDPLLSILVHREIRRTLTVVRASGEEIPLFRYMAPFNFAQVDYAFETLLVLLQFGDRVLLRAAWATPVRAPALLAGVSWGEEDYGVPVGRMSYIEFLIILSIRFLQSELRPDRVDPSAQAFNESIQSRAADFLHAILARTESMNLPLIHTGQGVIVRKLLYCIFSARLDLQPRMLQVLHGIAGLMDPQKAVVDVSTRGRKAAGVEAESREFPSLRSIGSYPLFVRTMLEALSMRTNRPVLQHWIDFILVCLPHFRPFFKRALLPLIRTLCDELSSYHAEMAKYVGGFSTESPTGSPSGAGPALLPQEFLGQAYPELDVLVLLYGLEKVITFCLSDGPSTAAFDAAAVSGVPDDPLSSPAAVLPSENPGLGLRFLTDYVSSVLFTADDRGAEAESAAHRLREAVVASLPNIFGILRQLFGLFDADPVAHSAGASLRFVGDRLRYRARRMLEAVYRSHAAEAVESLVEVWFEENSELDIDEDGDALNHVAVTMMEAIHGCTPRVVILTLVDTLRIRAAAGLGVAPKDRKKRSLLPATLPDTSLLRFLSVFSDRHASIDALNETWPTLLAYIKDCILQATASKHLFLPILRLMTVYFEKLSLTPYLEDKRVRREAEDTYQKVCDYCILIGGRAFDQGMWRRTVQVVDSDTATAGGEDTGTSEIVVSARPVVTGASSDAAVGAKRAAKVAEEDAVQEVVVYLGRTMIPGLRRFIQDQDRTMALLTNIMYYIVTPAFKSRYVSPDDSPQLPPELDLKLTRRYPRHSAKPLLNHTLDLLCAMTKLPFAYKAWRSTAWEAFFDGRFFQMSVVTSQKWRVVL
ncbi:hypothetical protein BDK51DRAFT_32227, partial [Blyttiomyces helicus]